MGQEQRDIERQIEQNRERLGETVEALSYKANVPARAKGYVHDKKDAVMNKLTGAKDVVSAGGQGVASQTESAAGQAQDVAVRGYHIVRDNPLGLAIGAAATGFVVGTLIPGTRMESERIGPMVDQMRERTEGVVSDAVEHGRQVAEDVTETAIQTAKESGREHADQLQHADTE